jgi:hypothetical protein
LHEIAQSHRNSIVRRKLRIRPQLAIISLFAAALIVSNGLWLQAATRDEKKYDQTLTENQIFEAFRPNSTVVEYYEVFKSYYVVEIGDNWSSELAAKYAVNFCADLARHDTGASQWQTLESSYYDTTGTHSFIDARTRLNLFLNLSGVRSDDDLVVKMEKILGGVNEFVDYVRDIHERFNSPWETLWLRSGDCDDYSILAAALFELVGIDSAITFLWNNTLGGHTAVLVHLDHLGIYNFSSYANLTGLGLQKGQWIFIEPQQIMDLQFDYPGKAEKWTIVAAAEV